MITSVLSAGHKWLSLIAIAVLAVFAGTVAASAESYHIAQDSVVFKKKTYRPAKVVYVAPPSRRTHVQKRVVRKAPVRRIARKAAVQPRRRSVNRKRVVRRKAVTQKRRTATRKVTARKGKKRRVARKKTTAGKKYRGKRGSLMATLKSVKPKGLPLRLAAAVVTVESGWRVRARGTSGEKGLMQLMPGTARLMGARGNLYNPRINMRAGTKYLYQCYRRARKNVAATIGCYNRGPGKMWAWNKNSITRRYVGKVRRYMRRG